MPLVLGQASFDERGADLFTLVITSYVTEHELLNRVAQGSRMFICIAKLFVMLGTKRDSGRAPECSKPTTCWTHLVLCVLLSVSLLSCDSQAVLPEDAVPSVTFTETVLETFDQGRIPAEQGTLTVLEHRTSGSSKTITLSFLRFKSQAANPAPPMVYLVGGPGNAGTEDAAIRYSRLFAPLLAYGDVIALDQRGTGQSEPNLACDLSVDLPPETWSNERALLDAFKTASHACAQRWSQAGVDLTAYTTRESANDLDALRRALGADKLTLIGYSYGTHLALAYAKQYPNRLHRLLLMGVEGPDHTLKLPSRIEEHLEDVAQLVTADPTYGPLLPNMVESLDALVRGLDAHPVHVRTYAPATQDSVDVVVNGFVVRLILSDLVAQTRRLPILPSVVYALLQEQYALVVQTVLATSAVQLPSAMAFMMNCASGVSPARLAQIRQEAPNTVLGTTLDFPIPDICDAWPAATLDDTFRAPIQSEVPTLIVSGSLDGRTPVSNGFEVLEGFPNGVHVILENGGHNDLNDFDRIPGYMDIIRAFLEDAPLPTTRLSLPFAFE